jgi:hypothetical protein
LVADSRFYYMPVLIVAEHNVRQLNAEIASITERIQSQQERIKELLESEGRHSVTALSSRPQSRQVLPSSTTCSYV